MSCALWIPEVKIANVDRMEPVTNIDAIPVSNVADTEPWNMDFVYYLDNNDIGYVVIHLVCYRLLYP